ncbi:hypothetical protein OL548_30265 [Lysinibacillus sp. MHQ-1]|nr:hypothetical protein OL548_30265 [Lysinibacillus sp. MHQ-1]
MKNKLVLMGIFYSLKQCLKKHLEIDNVAFLSFEGNSLIPIEEMASLTIETKLNAVSWLMIEASFYQQKSSENSLYIKGKTGLFNDDRYGAFSKQRAIIPLVYYLWRQQSLGQTL